MTHTWSSSYLDIFPYILYLSKISSRTKNLIHYKKKKPLHRLSHIIPTVLLKWVILTILTVCSDANLRDERNIKGEYLYTFANAPETTMVTIPTATLISQANRKRNKHKYIPVTYHNPF